MKLLPLVHRWSAKLNLPLGLLMVLLQRSPALRVVTSAVEYVLESPLGNVMKSSLTAAVALGGIHTIAGATELSPSTPSPAQLTVGVSANLAFSVLGTQTEPTSWVVGGSVPPGMTFQGGRTTGTIAAATLFLGGTPTTAGNFSITLVARDDPLGLSSPTFTYSFNVTGSANIAPSITTQPQSQTVTAGSNVTFSGNASGTPAPNFQWQKNGVDIGGATGTSLSLNNVQAGDAGNYTFVATNSAGSAMSNIAFLVVNAATSPPSFTTQPASQTVTVGNSVTFTAAADGNPAPTYQWQKNGNPIGGATGSSLTLNPVQLGDAGAYTVVASNSVGNATSNTATLTVNDLLSAPAFTLQPASQAVVTGGTVTFTTLASGNPAPTYQWKKDGVNIAGATNTSLTLNNLQAANAGSYTVMATNSQGNATSSAAILTILVLPAFTQQPVSQTVNAGQPVTFTVTATGNPAPTYQWKFNGGNIAGATNPTFTIGSVQLGNAGSYSVVATNPAGSVTSFGANLGVIPEIPLQFDPQGYLQRNPDVAAALGQSALAAWDHYYMTGVYEGRTFDDKLRVDEYLLLNADLAAAFGADKSAAALHWLNSGYYEGRLGRVPVDFDVETYLARYGDLQAVFGGLTGGARKVAAWNHYINSGVFEGRTDGDFSAAEYLAMYPDLQAAFNGNRQLAALHWYRTGRYEGRRIPAGFDVVGYYTRNMDIAAYFAADVYGAWKHYFTTGVYEGRVYDNLFRMPDYYVLNPDVAAAFGNDYGSALLHWLRTGRFEGRMAHL